MGEDLSCAHCPETLPDLASDPNPNRRPRRLSLASYNNRMNIEFFEVDITSRDK
jgi:hypothetical protein